MKTQGECLCGKTQFEFEGEPTNQVFCYCTECQKQTGADKWFGLWVPTDELKFTQGEPATYTRQGASGKDVNINYCPHCGGNLGNEITVGGFTTIPASALTDNKPYSPKMCLFTRSAPDWATFPEGVPKHEDVPEEWKQ